MTKPPLETVYGQPSWRIASDKVEAWLTPTGGHLGPVIFDLNGRKIQPFNIAPWHDEQLDDDLPPILKVLRGDFFCMPFGANETEFDGEQYPPHGETANGQWSLVGGRTSSEETTRATDLVVEMDLSVRRARIEKTISLRNDETVVYQSHRISGLEGPMTYGHHAMLRFPQKDGSGLISTSPFVYAATAPHPVELPENRGYSMLAPNRRFERLDHVPTITGEETDVTRYPARKGFEDLVMLVSDAECEFAWSAVSFPDEGYLWFALKNPNSLRNTVLWLSNRGRYYAPWSGRHECVLGVEEVTTYFHYGLSESVAPNPVSDLGYSTSEKFDRSETYEIRYLFGIAATPLGFGRVDSIESSGDHAVVIKDESDAAVEVTVDWRFVGG